MTSCEFTWDEPDGCTSPRGWLHLDNHPDLGAYGLSTCVGFYLDYGPKDYGLPREGGDILAVCYIFHADPRYREVRLGSIWAATAEDAKRFIESNVCAYFGIERKPMHHERVTA